MLRWPALPFSFGFLPSLSYFPAGLWAPFSPRFLVLFTSSYSLLTPCSGKVACMLVRFSFLLGRGMCVLQLWLLPVLEEGLGSSFHHALFSRSTLGDLHVASRFQSFFWEEGKGLLHAADRPFVKEERSPSLSPCIYTSS